MWSVHYFCENAPTSFPMSRRNTFEWLENHSIVHVNLVLCRSLGKTRVHVLSKILGPPQNVLHIFHTTSSTRCSCTFVCGVLRRERMRTNDTRISANNMGAHICADVKTRFCMLNFTARVNHIWLGQRDDCSPAYCQLLGNLGSRNALIFFTQLIFRFFFLRRSGWH